MTIDSSKSIPAFYAGQSIFLTGATGFLGKVFIEKVLRSCSDVREIFLLMRPKKGLNINERLEKMLNLPLYEKLREERPTNFEKLIPISGNVNEKELGLSAKDRQMLIERVTIIIHAAANVKFNIALKYAIFAHTRATRDICNLAQSIKNLILYEKLREERPTNFEKLIPISGNVNEKELGLSAKDRQMLIERVTIIIHAAANVKFNIALKYAIFAHTRATRDICNLAQSIKNLIALVYVSTAFAHVNKPIVEEKAYPPITDWQKIIKVAELLDEHTLNIFMAKYLDYIPNTYIFSKNLAESVIEEYSSSLPCAIVRPSIVMPSLKEPILGWIDNIYGPIGLFIGGGKGIIRIAYLNKYINQDAIPVDIVIKAILVVSWKLGLTTFTGSTSYVLNCTNQKHLTYQNGIKFLYSIGDEIPLEGIVWTRNTILTDNWILFYILTILLHILPAILIDLILKLSGRRPMLLRLQRKVYVVNRALSYFSFNEWKYSITNRLSLISSIPSDNQDMFSFDYSYNDIREYVKNSIIGSKKFLLHEDMNRLEAARAHTKRVYLFVTVFKTIIFIGVLWIINKWIYF